MRDNCYCTLPILEGHNNCFVLKGEKPKCKECSFEQKYLTPHSEDRLGKEERPN